MDQVARHRVVSVLSGFSSTSTSQPPARGLRSKEHAALQQERSYLVMIAVHRGKGEAHVFALDGFGNSLHIHESLLLDYRAGSFLGLQRCFAHVVANA